MLDVLVRTPAGKVARRGLPIFRGKIEGRSGAFWFAGLFRALPLALDEKPAHEGQAQNRGKNNGRNEAPDVEGAEGEMLNDVSGSNRGCEIARCRHERKGRKRGLPVAGAADVARQALSHRIHEHECKTGEKAGNEERENAEKRLREKKRGEPGSCSGKECSVNGAARAGLVEPSAYLDGKEGRKKRDAGEHSAGFKGTGSSRERIKGCRKAHPCRAGMKRERNEENFKKRQPALRKGKMGVRQSGKGL